MVQNKDAFGVAGMCMSRCVWVREGFGGQQGLGRVFGSAYKCTRDDMQVRDGVLDITWVRRVHECSQKLLHALRKANGMSWGST